MKAKDGGRQGHGSWREVTRSIGRDKRTLVSMVSESASHSALTRGALGEVVNLTKPMIESGLGGLDRPCASLITLCSSHLGHFYGQKLPKNGHIWVHRP